MIKRTYNLTLANVRGLEQIRATLGATATFSVNRAIAEYVARMRAAGKLPALEEGKNEEEES